MILASQNSGADVGRVTLSPAIQNRAHVVNMNDYSREALLAIAQQKRIDHAEILVDAFLEMKGVSMRTFYTYIESLQPVSTSSMHAAFKHSSAASSAVGSGMKLGKS